MDNDTPPFKDKVILHAKYFQVQVRSVYKLDTYAGMTSIFSVQCTKLGKHVRKKKVLNCRHCRGLRALQGSCSLTGVLQIWYYSVNRAIERMEKETLTTQDAQDAKAFAKKPPEMLQPEDMKLKLEDIAQVG